jgi:hypothetical protein
LISTSHEAEQESNAREEGLAKPPHPAMVGLESLRALQREKEEAL